ncbi:Chromo domain-containing protein [Cephalotus follicularis]|uniref:Chromo domain-containing protein n=1 Tax=Cephalotus follicularis TaxID=3775 RepID=A0A1Q3CIV9_CEPFO|nr:Chromo domain-containing protein [Cephalotus follicularis]
MVHLRKESYPKGIYHKLKSRKIGPCKIPKISSNAYEVELPDDLQISPIFNVAYLFDFHGFTDNDQGEEARGWAEQLPKKPKEAIEVIDMKKAHSRRGHSYRRFLVKWLGKTSIESTWISKKKLKRVDPAIYEEYVQVFSSELSLSTPRELMQQQWKKITVHAHYSSQIFKGFYVF